MNPDPLTSEPNKPVTSEPSNPITPTTTSPLTYEPHDPVIPDPDGSKRASRAVRRDGSQRLSKKEKRFQLSKDDGRYAELNPINPHEAKKEFGEKLRLNPVGPAFGGGVASPATTAEEEKGRVITSHNTSSVPGPEGGKCLRVCVCVCAVKPQIKDSERGQPPNKGQTKKVLL